VPSLQGIAYKGDEMEDEVTVYGCPYCFGPEEDYHTMCMDIEYTVPKFYLAGLEATGEIGQGRDST